MLLFFQITTYCWEPGKVIYWCTHCLRAMTAIRSMKWISCTIVKPSVRNQYSKLKLYQVNYPNSYLKNKYNLFCLLIHSNLFAEDNLLLCLTDSVLSMHSINSSNFPLIKTFEQTKGASLFALDNKVRSTTYINLAE